MSKKLEIYSNKLGEKIVVASEKAAAANLGWCLSGWSKSGGWKKPAAK